MCKESVKKTIRPQMSQLDIDAKRIAAGMDFGTVVRLSEQDMAMPKLDHGNHGASEVVDGYKESVIDDVCTLTRQCADALSLGDPCDYELNLIALAAEITAAKIQHYLKIKKAGSSEKRGA